MPSSSPPLSATRGRWRHRQARSPFAQVILYPVKREKMYLLNDWRNNADERRSKRVVRREIDRQLDLGDFKLDHVFR